VRLLSGALVTLMLALPGLAQLRPHQRVGSWFDARVVTIADGDTLELVPAGEATPLRIRLEGVDAPELGEPFSREATTLTRSLLLRQQVRVHGRDVDNYGRLVARVVAAGRDASEALLDAGLACHFTRFANDPVLARAQSRARDQGRGFWAAGAAKPRCTGLSGSSRQTAPAARSADGYFRGNTNSRLYHAASCPNAKCRNCTRLFTSEDEARRAGFKPAGDCLR
jgi:endonuclease YncB( thermonuclease family)